LPLRYYRCVDFPPKSSVIVDYDLVMRTLILIFCAIAVLALGLPVDAHEFAYVATLSGPAEFPANASPGTGSVIVTLDLDLVQMHVEVVFSGLEGIVTAAHIHSATAVPGQGVADVATPVPTFPDFPSGVTSGTYDHTLNLGLASGYNPAFITANGGTVSDALNALVNGLNAGMAYLNIHTTSYGSGEIRGFLLPAPKTDFNHDGVVDGADLALWREAFGVSHEGDANDDELTDGADFLLWQRQVGSVAQLPPAAAAVPEPSALSLTAVFSLIALLCRRFRSWPTKKRA
jgi:hypothetical protein